MKEIEEKEALVEAKAAEKAVAEDVLAGAKTPSRWLQFLFPISIASQLQAGFIGMILILAGCILGGALPVWNLNLLAPLIVGYFYSRKIHPKLWIGPLAITLSIMGLSWVICMVFDIGSDEDTALMIAQFGLNIFLTMMVGSGVSAIIRRYRRSS